MLITITRVLAAAATAVTLAGIHAIDRLVQRPPQPIPIPVPARHQMGPRVLPDPTRHHPSHLSRR